MFAFGGINYYRARILSFNSIPKGESVVSIADAPAKITIPSIDIDLSIDQGQIKNGAWEISETNATFLTNSVSPKKKGNVVIYGHNKKAIFGNLPYLSIGQDVIIKTGDGSVFTYTVTEKYFVGPDRVDLVSQNGSSELTLYTCWGVFDNQRAVIKAKPKI